MKCTEKYLNGCDLLISGGKHGKRGTGEKLRGVVVELVGNLEIRAQTHRTLSSKELSCPDFLFPYLVDSGRSPILLGGVTGAIAIRTLDPLLMAVDELFGVEPKC